MSTPSRQHREQVRPGNPIQGGACREAPNLNNRIQYLVDRARRTRQVMTVGLRGHGQGG